MAILFHLTLTCTAPTNPPEPFIAHRTIFACYVHQAVACTLTGKNKLDGRAPGQAE